MTDSRRRKKRLSRTEELDALSQDESHAERVRSFVLGHSAEEPEPVNTIIDHGIGWEGLTEVKLRPRHLVGNRIFDKNSKNRAIVTFDALRARLVKTLIDNEWSRVAITSPTRGCGKTFLAANLAMSCARQTGLRSVLFDMDFRKPKLSQVLGVRPPGPFGEYLYDCDPPENHLLRLEENLAVALNDRAMDEPTDLLLSERTEETIAIMQDALSPDVVLFDMPPMLEFEDVMTFLPRLDGVLLVSGGLSTKAEDVREVESRLDGKAPLLGVVLNMAEGASFRSHR